MCLRHGGVWIVNELDGKALCLKCKDPVAALKEYYTRWNYHTKRSPQYFQFIGMQWPEKLENLKQVISSQQNFFTKIKK